jgi:aerobic carbon-monoxide dehydrogenase medium subunit
MKPAPFLYYRAASLEEAVGLLNGPAANGKVLAGGQSLVPLLNLRLARPEALIDLNPIANLSYIRLEAGGIVIGALTRQREIEFSALLAEKLPILVEAVRQIGHPAIRNRGTLGGSVAHADPAAELPCVLTALDAAVVAVGPAGERTIPAKDFFVGYYATALGDGEILKEVRIPLVEPPAGWSFLEFARRHGDFALAEASVLLYAGHPGHRSARVVTGGTVERPLRLSTVEKFALEEIRFPVDKDSLARALKRAEELAKTEIRSSGAARSDSEYDSHLSGVLVGRALKQAIERWSNP